MKKEGKLDDAVHVVGGPCWASPIYPAARPPAACCGGGLNPTRGAPFSPLPLPLASPSAGGSVRAFTSDPEAPMSESTSASPSVLAKNYIHMGGTKMLLARLGQLQSCPMFLI